MAYLSFSKITSDPPYGATWYQSCITNDGLKIWVKGAASYPYDGVLGYSDDGGATWSYKERLTWARNYTSLCVNSTGSILYKCMTGSYDSYLYKSTNQGTSWSSVAWTYYYPGSLRCSDDGSVIIYGYSSAYGHGFGWSTNSGAGWTYATGKAGLTKVDVSADGTKMIRSVYGGRVEVSSNSGTSWTEVQPVGNANKNWVSVHIGDNGATIYANEARSWKSTDFGTNWTEIRPWGDNNTSATYAVSKDGTTILATYSGNTKCKQSVDSGANWEEINNDYRPQQGCLALDKEGTRGIIGGGSSGTMVWLGSRVLDTFVPQIIFM